MARLGRLGLVAIAVVFHLVYIASIFDIYFVSPIVHGMRAFPSAPRDAPPPAQRLVLIVADGLRADKAFQSFPDPSPADPDDPDALRPRPLMPFIRSRIHHDGTFGVSHTRMPTESRPGHVALIAGLYEDVSSVTTGWKLNPVNFDSVFNRSRHTWSWGSPDILPMFKDGAVPGRVDADAYGEEAEDFTADATQLDTWVFERVEALFASARTNLTLDKRLRQDRNVFFLHLLGLDTSGHSYRPYSKEYLHNIKVVDQGVQHITELIDSFYGDGRTAYVFTADHGMSDWGSHGDGHPDNTRTPLVAWGSGVRKPVKTAKGLAPGHEDGFSSDWGFDTIARHDVAQADVAALMAYLVGLAFPVNSVGELPLPYLAASDAAQASALLVNAQSVVEMYRVKEEQKSEHELRFRPYPAFQGGAATRINRTTQIQALIDNHRYEEAVASSRQLLHDGLAGLRYLQTYDWLFLRALVTLGYLGWMAFAAATVIDLHVLHSRTKVQRSSTSLATFGAVLTALYSWLLIRHAPVTYYAYAICPVVFWEEVYARRDALFAARNLLVVNADGKTLTRQVTSTCAWCLLILEALVLSYSHREVYSLCYLAATVWPFTYGKRFIDANRSLLVHWVSGCLLMSLFTLLPVIKVESSTMILVGGFLMLCVGAAYLLFDHRLLGSSAASSPTTIPLSRILVGMQVGLIALAMIVTHSSIASLQAKRGLPVGNQVVGWLVLILSLATPFLHGLAPNRHYIHRLMIIFLAFSPTFIILTISYEALFYFSFSLLLLAWIRIEHHIYTYTTKQNPAPRSPLPTPKPLDEAASAIVAQLQSPDEGAAEHGYRALTLGDTRISLFFFFLLQSAFFSTGNIASISSFSLDAVYRLIPIFNPFSQGALLMYKILIPFALISAALGILNRRLDVAPSALFMVVMALSDVLTLNFFWLVRDEGSWLDIGTSISHFSIASMLCAFIAALEFFSEVFVAGVEVDQPLTRNLTQSLNGRAEGKPDKALTRVGGGKVGNGVLHGSHE